MSDLHLDILIPEAKILFPFISHFKEDFYMAGGTGLALQIGHRISVDFDLFSALPIKKTLLKKIEEVFKNITMRVLVNNPNELTVFIDEVKFTFLHYPFPIILPLIRTHSMLLLSVKEIIATKAYTIGRRGELKDYVDMYIGLKDRHVSLSEVIDLARQKYGDAFHDRLFLEQLVYFDDLEEFMVSMKNSKTPSKIEMVDYFSSIVEDIVL